MAILAPGIIIPPRFQTEVRTHLFLNFVGIEDQSVIKEVPLILGIFGSPGDGKTFQLRHLLRDYKVDARSINAADLESDRAGQPGKLVLEAYVGASREIDSGTPSALVVDDIDTTVGEWEKNTGTVNHQQVLAQLMHLADRPSFIERIGRIRRAPIFMTGNDFGKLYPPLKRPGRMTHFPWTPSAEERREIVIAILGEIAGHAVIEELLIRYQHQPVAFFAQLRTAMLRSAAAAVIERSSENLVAVVREPVRYARYVAGSFACPAGSANCDIFDEAEILNEKIAMANISFCSK